MFAEGFVCLLMGFVFGQVCCHCESMLALTVYRITTFKMFCVDAQFGVLFKMLFAQT